MSLTQAWSLSTSAVFLLDDPHVASCHACSFRKSHETSPAALQAVPPLELCPVTRCIETKLFILLSEYFIELLIIPL